MQSKAKRSKVKSSKVKQTYICKAYAEQSKVEQSRFAATAVNQNVEDIVKQSNQTSICKAYALCRANAMQRACQETKGTMAAILGLSDDIVEFACNEIDGIVKPANYNCPGQLVISGELSAVEKACELLKEKGARRALILPVSGAFHSDLMNSASSFCKNSSLSD